MSWKAGERTGKAAAIRLYARAWRFSQLFFRLLPMLDMVA